MLRRDLERRESGRESVAAVQLTDSCSRWRSFGPALPWRAALARTDAGGYGLVCVFVCACAAFVGCGGRLYGTVQVGRRASVSSS